jgi:hypothetical protein
MKKLILVAIVYFFQIQIFAQIIWTSETKLKGTIGNYKIDMTLAVPLGGGSTCFTVGEYYYLSNKKVIDLCSEDDEKIIENYSGNPTGYFIIKDWDKKIGSSVVGTWYSMDEKKSYPVNLKVVGKGEN